MNEISLIPTQDLIQELMDRSDALVYCALLKKTDNDGTVTFSSKGNYFTKIGMVDYLGNRIHEDEYKEAM